MATIERGLPLVERIIERLTPHVKGFVQGAGAPALDAIESRIMVELPPTLRRFLEFDFTFASFGSRWQGKRRFGKSPRTPHARVSSVHKMAEAMTELGWTSAKLKKRVIRLPNLPDHPWNGLYLGEPRHDGELPILGMVNDETNVLVYLRYTAFDLYLVEQSGLIELNDAARLDDLEGTLSLNPELGALVPDDDYEPNF
jgi:hypothetical protein